MFSLIWILCTTLIPTTYGQESVDVVAYEALLQEAAVSVLRQHAEEMSLRISAPPAFDVPEDGMRSFIPDTGIGNREELFIEGIRNIPVFSDASLSYWRYSRFNSTDYILAYSEQGVILSKLEGTSEDYVVFSKEEALLRFVPEYLSTVTDVILFTRFVKRSAILYVAILTQSVRNNGIKLYEIIGDKSLPVSFIELRSNPYVQQFTIKKIAYVQSQYGESLVVLIDSPGFMSIGHQQQGSNELNHYIEIYYPNAVDLVSFTVNGHGYLAVSNATTCEIYKLDGFARNHLLFDRLSFAAGNIQDLEYFRLGFHHYLAISGSFDQYLYTWKSGEFSLKQRFSDYGVSRVYPVELLTCQDEVVLLSIQEHKVDVYVYNGKNEEFVKTNAALPPNFRIFPSSITSFPHKNKAILLFLNFEGDVVAAVIDTKLEAVPNPILETGKVVSQRMKDIQKTLDDQERQIQEMKQVLVYAVHQTGDQYITAFQSFDQLQTNQGAIVSVVQDPVYVEWEGSSLTLEEYKQGTRMLQKSIEELEKIVDEVESIMPDIVRIDEPAVITGRKQFKAGISGTSLSAFSVILESAGGINLPQLQQDLYRLDKPEKIEGTLTFEQPLTIVENLEIETTLNGIDIDKEVMTTNTEQTSYATMVFENILEVEGDVQLSGKLNGIDISQDIVTLNGNHHITGKKTFLGGIVAGSVETQSINGIDIKDMYEKAMMKTTDQQEIPGLKTFSGGLVTGDIVVSGLVNGYNITELAESIVRVDTPAVITGRKTFTQDVTVKGDLTVLGTVNGLRIPQDLFLTDVGDQMIDSEKEFTGTVTAENVVVSGTIDDLKIPSDIVTLTDNEDISSTLIFTNGINVQNDMIVEGLVDGVDISELPKDSFKRNETSGFTNAVFIGPVTITGNLEVQGTVNGVNLDELVKDVVYKGEKNIIIESEKSFKKITADTIRIDRMNGYSIPDEFMTVNGDQVITGTKTFKKSVTFSDVNIGDNMIGGVDINQIYQNRRVEDVTGDIEFSDVVVEGDLTVQGRVGGLRIPGDLVLRSSIGDTIENKVFTGTVKVNHLIVDGDATVLGLFGGVDLVKFNQSRLTLDTDQVIQGDLWIGNGSVTDLGVTGLVNGRNFLDFAENVMSKTKDQTVTEEKEFKGKLTVHGPITTTGGINGFNLAYLNDRAFKLNDDNFISVPMEFNDITVQDMNVSGLINGVNLTEWIEDSLKKKADIQFVSGVNVFEEGFHVEGDISADTVNDLVIPDAVLLANVPQTINGQFTFEGLTVSGDMHISGLINGLDLSDTAPRIARVDHDTVIESNVTFSGPIHVYHDIEVTGTVNGIDFKKLSDDVLVKNEDQVVTGHKILRGGVTIQGDVDVEYINGVKWRDFIEDVVRIDMPQVIPSPKTFVNDIEVGDMYSGTMQVGLINGINLKELVNDAVFVDEPTNITGVKTFKRSVEIEGDLNADLINGLRLKTDVITLTCNEDGPQVIRGQKTFGNVTVYGDIHVRGKVNGHNLRDLYKDTLLTEGNQNITGTKTLQNTAVFKEDVNVSTVNGMVLRDNLVTLHTNQTLEGPLTFDDDLALENLQVEGFINGVDVSELIDLAVFLDEAVTMDGDYYFENVTVTSDLKVDGTVNDIPLKVFDRNVSLFWENVNQSLITMDKQSRSHCDLAHYLQNALAKSYYILDGFTVHQELSYPASYIHSQNSKQITLVYFDTETSPAAVLHSWNDQSKKFEPSGPTDLRTKFANIVVERFGITEIHINIGINCEDSFVTINNFSAAISNGFKDGAVLIRKTDAVLALLFPSRGVVELYRVRNSMYPEVYNYRSATVGKDATSVAVFEIRDSPYLAVSSLYAPPYVHGYCQIYGRVNDNWQKIQSINVAASTQVKHFFYHNYYYLAFINVAPMYETKEPKSIQVYRNSGPNPLLFSLFQKIPFDDAKGVEFFEFGDLSEIYLTTWNDTKIRVYRLEGESGFRTMYTLNGNCIKDLKPLQIDGDIYLAVGQQHVDSNIPVTSVLYKGLIKGTRYIPRNFDNC